MPRSEVFVQVYPQTKPERILLPDTLEEYTELWTAIERFRVAGQFETWKALMRLWSAGDAYFRLVFVLSAGREAKTRWRTAGDGRPALHFWHPSHIQISRTIQFQREPLVLIASRGLGKSTHGSINDNIGRKLAPCTSGDLSWGDANHASLLFSATREFAQKHQGAIKQELENNELLKDVWDDRFWKDPQQEAPTWSLQKGLFIRRTTARQEATFAAEAFVDRLPTGAHPDKKYYDDIEEERAVSTEDMMTLVEERYISSKNLKSANADPDLTIGTYYHPQGLLVKLGTYFSQRTVVFAGEDLSFAGKIPTEEAGPLGGKPRHGMTREQLFEDINNKGGLKNPRARRDHGRQICCDPLAGESLRLDRSRIKFYDEEPRVMARWHKMVGIICGDCSRGLQDPTALWVWGLGPGRRLYWLDGARGRWEASRRKHVIYELAQRWWNILDKRLHQIRIEEFGQAEYVPQTIDYFQQQGFGYPEHNVVSCSFGGGRGALGKVDRIYSRWEPLLQECEVHFPNSMVRTDERGDRIDLVEYFLTQEFSLFPKPATDDMLDAGALLLEPAERVGPLPWPRTRMELWDDDTQPVYSGTMGDDNFDDGFAGMGIL